SLLGSLRVRLVLGGGLAAVGHTRVDLGRTLRGRHVAGVGGGLLGRRLARRLRVASLLAPPPAARAPRRFRLGQVARERGGDLRGRAELLAGRLEELRRPRRVAVGRGEERRRYRERQLAHGDDELRRVLFVAVAARVGERAEQALRLRVLGARLAVERLAGRPREPPRPADEDLLGRVRLAVADRLQEHADARLPVLLPRRRLRDERDEVVEAGAVDAHGHAVGERHHPQAAVGVLRRAREQERLQGGLARAPIGELLHERLALLEPEVAARECRPVALLVLVQVARVDPLPLAGDDAETPLHVRRDGDEPRRRRQLPPRAPLHPPARRRDDARALPVE